MMSDTARDGLQRLNARVPLARRQHALPETWRALHRAILQNYATIGAPPDPRQLRSWPGLDDPAAALARLADDDLIVCDAPWRVTGAYPFSSEQTPHRVLFAHHEARAMCAVDALAVAALFVCPTTVVSRCAESDREVQVKQTHNGQITEASDGLQLGIRWQESCGHTAHSLCQEMVFLAGDRVAARWMNGAGSGRCLYTLDEALAIAMAFFLPLVGRETSPATRR